MAVVTGTDASELLEGTAASNTISGHGGADTLTGGAGADRLDGGDGDDRLFGYGGDDTLIGGSGDDRLFAAFGRNVVDGGRGFDTASIGPSPVLSPEPVSFTASGTSARYVQGDAVTTFTGVEAFIVLGGAGDDDLAGGLHADWLIGGAGRDTVMGGDGADTLGGGAGADLFTGSAGDLAGDVIIDLDTGDRVLVEGAGASTHAAYDGDVLTIWTGRDAAGVTIDVTNGLSGTFANDGTGAIVFTPTETEPSVGTGRIDLPASAAGERMVGTEASNTLHGGGGADSLMAGGGDDALFGGAGDDLVFGGSGDDVIGGGDGDDVLAAGAGDDLVFGSTGDDTVFVADGADTVYGGQGDDVVFLGRGDGARDVYASVSKNGSDTLYGFEAGADVLDLTASGITNASELGDRLGRNAEGHVTIDLGDGDLLTLNGMARGDLTNFELLL